MKSINSYLLLFACLGAIIFTACEEEDIDQTQSNPTYDCETLQADSGDICVIAVSPNEMAYGYINNDCECEVSNDPIYDCPDIEANVGDPCDLGTGGMGVVQADCSCSDLPPDWDCIDLQLNIGDLCDLPNSQVTGVVNMNCECEDPINAVYDCPDFYGPGLGANTGDSCTTVLGAGLVTATCECEANNTGGFDCPGLGGNIGDPCQNGWGIITADCDCEENNTVYDCPEFWGPGSPGANIGDFVEDNVGNGNLNADCEIDYVLCYEFNTFPGDSCMTAFGGVGIVSADCQCE